MPGVKTLNRRRRAACDLARGYEGLVESYQQSARPPKVVRQKIASAPRTRLCFSAVSRKLPRDSSIWTQGNSLQCERIMCPPLKGLLTEISQSKNPAKQLMILSNQAFGHVPDASLRQTPGLSQPASAAEGGPTAAIV